MSAVDEFISLVLLVCLQCCAGQHPRSFNWCDQSLNCGPQKNSMCILTKKVNTNECFFMENVMTSEDKRLLLALHNSVRDQLAGGDISGWPTASDMRMMSWDDTLAAQATLWAYQCNYTSDPCPRHPYYPRVGQTAIEVGDTGGYHDVRAIFTKMVNTGRTNGKFIDRWDPKSAVGTETRNFHQIIFARQTAVGCGLVRYLKTKEGGGGKKVALFSLSLWCNYGIGLQTGEKVYTKGNPCGSCPDKTKCRPESTYPNLCSASGDPLSATFLRVVSSNGHKANSATLVILSTLLIATKRDSAVKH